MRRKWFGVVLATSAQIALVSGADAQPPEWSKNEQTFAELLTAIDQNIEADDALVTEPDDGEAGQSALKNRSSEVEAAVREARKDLEKSKRENADSAENDLG